MSEYPAEAYAASLGLPGTPQIKLLDQAKKNKSRAANKPVEPLVVHQRLASSEPSDIEESDDESGSEEEEEESDDDAASSSGSEAPLPTAPAVRTKYDRMFERKNQDILTDHYNKLVSHEDDDDDVFTLARKDHDLELSEGEDGEQAAIITSEDLSKRKLKDASTKKGQLRNRPGPQKVLFGEDGEERDFYAAGLETEQMAAAEREAYVAAETERMREADVVDRAVARDKKREKKRKRKEREREAMAAMQSDGEDEPMVYLGGSDDESARSISRSPSPQPAPKRRKEVDDEEELALRLLRGE